MLAQGLIGALAVLLLAYIIRARLFSRIFELEILELRYDPKQKEAELILRNHEPIPLFIKPTLRRLNFITEDDLQQQAAVPMAAGQHKSLITGYDLVAEHQNPLFIEEAATQKIRFDIPEDTQLKPLDNVRVDVEYGFTSYRLEAALTKTLTLRLETQKQDKKAGAKRRKRVEDEFLEWVRLIQIEHLTQPTITPVLEPQKEEPGKPERTVERMGFPVEARCVCCGKDQRLEWIVDQSHVCGGCKDFLAPNQEIAETQEEPVREDLELKPRHRIILGVLHEEGMLTNAEVAEKTRRSKKNTSRDLRELANAGLIDKHKLGSQISYSPA